MAVYALEGGSASSKKPATKLDVVAYSLTMIM
jgi:hypothetical protein